MIYFPVVVVRFMDNPIQNYSVLSWNIRGLNSVARQEEIRQVVQMHKPMLLCLQETKMQDINRTTILNALGCDYLDNYLFLPANGARGGILLAWRDNFLRLDNVHLTTNTISALVTDMRTNVPWTITGVYGPQTDVEKKEFLNELRQLKQWAQPTWLIAGDFNLICNEDDKNNDRLDRRMMLRFRRTLNHLGVAEIPLQGRKFTWSNDQNHPTMTRIDRIFCTPAWEEIYAQPVIYPLSSSVSDHCPLFLAPLSTVPPSTKFRFESFWIEMPGFKECVAQAWQEEVPAHHNPFMRLRIKLSRTAKALRQWAKTLIPQGKLAMAICREVIYQMDAAREARQLTEEERELKKLLKHRLLGLAAIEKARAKQKSRLRWLKKGDINSKYFQIMANFRKRKNFIHALQKDTGTVTTQGEKHQVIYDHFLQHIGTYIPRSCSLNFETLGWSQHQLHHLEEPFTEHEITQIIKQLNKEKAPGPDGYIGAFFAACWDIVKNDIMLALTHFYNLNSQNLHFLNQAYVVLIPKKKDPIKVSDYKSCDSFRMSLYADAAAVFIQLTAEDYRATNLLLHIFGEASGLKTNLEKTEIYPIRCDNINLAEVLGNDQRTSLFPCRYLGLPLHYRKLPRASIQPLVQHVANRLPGWKRRYFTYPGREVLIKSVLSAIPVFFFLTVFRLPIWAIHRLERFQRSFLWRGDEPDKIHGGHCLVKWSNCARPKKLVGLGIKEFNRALRLRWLWFAWDDQERPWKGIH